MQHDCEKYTIGKEITKKSSGLVNSRAQMIMKFLGGRKKVTMWFYMMPAMDLNTETITTQSIT